MNIEQAANYLLNQGWVLRRTEMVTWKDPWTKAYPQIGGYSLSSERVFIFTAPDGSAQLLNAKSMIKLATNLSREADQAPVPEWTAA